MGPPAINVQAVEAALRRSEANFRTLIENLPLGVWVHRDGRIVYVNPAMVSLAKAGDAARLIGSSPLQLTAEDYRPAVIARIKELQAQTGPVAHTAPAEFPLVCVDGSSRWVEVEAFKLDFDGEPSVVVLCRDLTERRELLSRLAIADRLASMGTLAAGVAHEINNPLTWTLANVALVERAVAAAAAEPAKAAELLRPATQLLGEIREGAERVRDVVRDLRSLSRPESEASALVDVREALEASVRVAQNELRHVARLERALGEVPRVLANPSRLGQVFLNLLVNAAQAIVAGRPEQNLIRIATRTAPGGEAVIEVSDTGAGIAPAVLGRIFDPFFTTKPAGVGTGLGLPICHGIVTSLGGTIAVESTPGRGTTFRVTLPPGQGASTPAPAPEPQPLAFRARVLIVDDEVHIGATLKLLLEESCEVTVMTSARDALADLDGGRRYDAVLCDLMMPDVSGIDLYESLAQRHPAMTERMVFMTGGAFTARAREFLDRVKNARLEKPFLAQELLQVLARVCRRA